MKSKHALILENGAFVFEEREVAEPGRNISVVVSDSIEVTLANKGTDVVIHMTNSSVPRVLNQGVPKEVLWPRCESGC